MAKKDTRLRILKTAEMLFSIDGYDGVPTKQIASEAGVTEMTLFNHFGNKEMLYKTIVKERFLTMDHERAFSGLVYNDLESDLQKVTNAMINNFFENRNILMMRLKEKESFHNDDTFKMENDPMYKRIVPLFEIYEQKGLLNGQAEDIALLFMSAIKGLFHLFVLENKDEIEMTEMIRGYVNLICNGLKCQ